MESFKGWIEWNFPGWYETLNELSNRKDEIGQLAEFILILLEKIYEYEINK